MNILSKESAIRQLQSKCDECDELSKQVDMLKRYINDIGEAVTARYNEQANTFLDPYNEDYIKEMIDLIRDI